MTIKTLLAAAVLMATPVIASAQCMWGDHSGQEAAISCAEGMTYDAVAMECVAVAAS